jgi:Protein of unknown function (DUF4058)
MTILDDNIESYYRILVSRSETRPKAALYAFNLRDRIPKFPLPLQPEDTEPLLDLQQLLQEIYDQGGYELRIDYNRPPEPTLSEADLNWIDRILRERGLR